MSLDNPKFICKNFMHPCKILLFKTDVPTASLVNAHALKKCGVYHSSCIANLLLLSTQPVEPHIELANAWAHSRIKSEVLDDVSKSAEICRRSQVSSLTLSCVCLWVPKAVKWSKRFGGRMPLLIF